MKNRMLHAGAIGMLAIAPARVASGGWAVITVKDLPDQVIAGRSFTVDYTVRQHGSELLSGLNGAVTASSDGRTVTAEVAGGNGHYVATLTLPAPGDWTIAINSGFLGNSNTLDPIPAVTPDAAPAGVTSAVRGRHLFVAKGCVTCHVSRDVPQSGVITIGPELIRGRLAADYVAGVLADPTTAARQPGSFRMPNLDLKPAEIAALVQFLTGSSHSIAAGN